MSEDADDSSKTEEPTAKKLDQARERGQVATSRELNTWVMLLVGTIIFAMMAPGFMTDIKATLRRFVEAPHLFDISAENSGVLFGILLSEVYSAMILPLALIFFAALGAAVMQTGIRFTPKAIEPKLEKFDLVKGAKRLFSTKQLVEFAKGIVKLAVVATVGAIPVLAAFDGIDLLVTYSIPDFVAVMHDLVIAMLTATVAVIAVIAIIDVVYQRYEHTRQLRMTKQEVKEEYKQAEGDPHVKGRLRRIRAERARARMMQAVPDADVVVTNPTHYAVALKYRPEEMEAPILVAKGLDNVALRIREVAEENDVTIVENPPLARALHATVELDQQVPPDHYKAVAEIISYVWSLRGRPVPGGSTAR